MKQSTWAIIAVVILVGGYFSLKPSFLGGGPGGQTAISCSVSTVAAAVVGNQNSSTLLSASTNRAWARITQVKNSSDVATNTVYVSFDEGAAATLYNGVTLATATPSIDFGKNTDFPYTGAVTGITTVGSTTVEITQCIY